MKARFRPSSMRSMKIPLRWIVVLASLLTVWGAANEARAEVAWRKSFATAQADAAKTQKLLFVEFTVPG